MIKLTLTLTEKSDNDFGIGYELDDATATTVEEMFGVLLTKAISEKTNYIKEKLKTQETAEELFQELKDFQSELQVSNNGESVRT